MKKRLFALALCLVTALMLLAGCGGPAASTPADPVASAVPPRSSAMVVTVTNDSSYVFNELYVTPTADNSWGSDHLGSTSILKKNGSFDISVQAYDFDNYDIRVVDEDEDVYIFEYVTLYNGTEVMISFADGLVAYVFHADGSDETVYGTLQSADGGGGGGGGGNVEDVVVANDGTATEGAFSFEVYNESNYDIYALYIGVLDASSEYDIDLLPAILSAGDSTTVNGSASRGDWANTEWTLFVKDVDGDVSASFSVFNPWTVAYVDIYWDNSQGGYVCEFAY